MAHQTHSLPWNTLASNFKCRISHHHGGSNRECLPLEPDIWPLNKPNQEKELAYFTQAFAQQIQEFGKTERAKYPPQEVYKMRARTWIRSTPPTTSSEPGREDGKGKKAKQSGNPNPETRGVISPELMKHYEEMTDPLCTYTILYVLGKIHPSLDQQNSKVENWLLKPGDCYHNNIPKGDTTKLLIMEASGALPALRTETSMRDSIESLLLMCNHPQIDILSLKNMSWGHHFGVSRVAEEALKEYIYVNLLVVMMENGDEVCDIVDEGGERRKYMDCDSYKKMLYSVAGYFDGDAQSVVHRVFFYEEPKEGWKDGAHRNRCAGEVERDILSNLERLREHLKGVWKLMVIYDLVIREAGGDPDWENECKQVFAWVFGVRYEYV